MTPIANLQNPVKVIRAHCLDCCYGQPTEVAACPVESCALHPFRMGKNPYRAKREISEERRAQLGEALSAAREKRKEVTG